MNCAKVFKTVVLWNSFDSFVCSKIYTLKYFFLRKRSRKKSEKPISNSTNGTHAGLQFVVNPQPVVFNEVKDGSPKNESDKFARSSATNDQRKLSLLSDEYKSSEEGKGTTIKSHGTETTEKRSKKIKRQKNATGKNGNETQERAASKNSFEPNIVISNERNIYQEHEKWNYL